MPAKNSGLYQGITKEAMIFR